MDFNELENIVIGMKEKVKKHDEDIKELKSDNKILAKAIEDNTKAQIENTVTMREFKKQDEEKRKQDAELYRELNNKLEKFINKGNIEVITIIKKSLFVALNAIIGGMIAYLLF